MYSRIIKIYYREIVGHMFMKPVQIEGTQQFFPQQVILHHSSHFCR
jgi:hypothetical protein